MYAHRRRLLTDALDARDLPWPAGPDGLNVWIPLVGVAEAAPVEESADHGWAVRSGALLAMTRGAAVRVTTATLTPEHTGAFAERLSTTLTPTDQESPCSPA